MNTKQLDISAAFDWLPEGRNMGSLRQDILRGNATYSFTYNDDWLRSFPHLVLSADLMTVRGPQYKKNSVFGMFQDALPDRWGRRLMDKRERLLADMEKRLPRVLSDYDYLMQVDDSTRMGALRFRSEDGWVGDDSDMPVPPFTQLREFTDMAQAFEKSDEDGTSIREQWIRNLFRQGSSLGGARPKANVRDTDGTLYVAKIPSIHDDYDVALWEHFAHCLAREAGIDAAETRLLPLPGQRYHTLLSRRFDRQADRRIHFASAMTLCGLADGADADSDNGYLDIVDIIIGDRGFEDVHAALLELYRRVVFNCMIGNHDDHFRNHGFLLTARGWKWSPAYDLNPTNMMTQSLLINSRSNDSSLDQLRQSAAEYMLLDKEAKGVMDEVVKAVSGWRRVATRCGITMSEQQRFALRLDSCLH